MYDGIQVFVERERDKLRYAVRVGGMGVAPSQGLDFVPRSPKRGVRARGRLSGRRKESLCSCASLRANDQGTGSLLSHRMNTIGPQAAGILVKRETGFVAE